MDTPITLFCTWCEREQGEFNSEDEIKTHLEKHYSGEDYEIEEDEGKKIAFFSCANCFHYEHTCHNC